MKHKKGDKVDGWVVVDKPSGIGSTQLLSRVRRLYNAQKAGHAGTLDPMASGVLPVALGEATKTLPFMTDFGKAYDFTISFGTSTDTEDADGVVVATSEKTPSEKEISAVLPALTGDILQVPPAYSAVHVDGKRAYDLARQNKEVSLTARPVRVDSLTLNDMPDEKTARFSVACGTGTYVRSLSRDIVAALGVCGHVTVLRRTKSGKFSLSDTISLEKLETMGHSSNEPLPLLPVETVLDDILALAVTEKQAALLANGGFLPVSAFFRADIPPDGTTARARCGGRLAALVRVCGATIRPARVFTGL